MDLSYHDRSMWKTWVICCQSYFSITDIFWAYHKTPRNIRFASVKQVDWLIMSRPWKDWKLMSNRFFIGICKKTVGARMCRLCLYGINNLKFNWTVRVEEISEALTRNMKWNFEKDLYELPSSLGSSMTHIEKHENWIKLTTGLDSPLIFSQKNC